MSRPKFFTITGDDWRAMFARARANGAAEGNAVLTQIRAGLARDAKVRPSLRDEMRKYSDAPVTGDVSNSRACLPHEALRS